ncbi:uncharacterized protein LOC34618099 [Cyclospora cayetanensis]|nr:uncharacterized protein LOC34618099 [Cyclospora cayetanensis]
MTLSIIRDPLRASLLNRFFTAAFVSLFFFSETPPTMASRADMASAASAYGPLWEGLHKGELQKSFLNRASETPAIADESTNADSSAKTLDGPLWRLSVPLFSGYTRIQFWNFPAYVQWLICVSFLCLLGSLLTFLWPLFSHLSHYYEPKLQRMICRIGCAMPLFAILSSAACISVLTELGVSQVNFFDSHPLARTPQGIIPLRVVQPETVPTWTAAAAVQDTAESLEANRELAMQGPDGIDHIMWGAPLRELASSPNSEEVSFAKAPQRSSRAGLHLASSLVSPPESHKPSSTAEHTAEDPSGVPLLHKEAFTRESYYLQQQLFFELGKQLVQSTALYSFSSLMINICGGYRCLSLTLGCDGHAVPFVFPFSYWLPPFLPNPRALRSLKLGVMQFVFVLPLWSAARLLADQNVSNDQSRLYAPSTHHSTRTNTVATSPWVPVGNSDSENVLKKKASDQGASQRKYSGFGGSYMPPGVKATIPYARRQGSEGGGAVDANKQKAQLTTSSKKSLRVQSSLVSDGKEALPVNGKGDLGQDAEENSETVFRPSPHVLIEAVLATLLSLSMFTSMLSLSQFYLITEPYLLPYNPQNKFFLIKLLVFTNSWQRLIIGILALLGVLPSVGGDTGIDIQQGIDLYHNMLMNIWALLFSVMHWRCFPVAEHLPEPDEDNVAYLDKPKTPSVMHALLDVCFSVDLIVDAQEAVLTPQMSLDRAYSLLRQQTAHNAVFFRNLKEKEDTDTGPKGADAPGGQANRSYDDTAGRDGPTHMVEGDSCQPTEVPAESPTDGASMTSRSRLISNEENEDTRDDAWQESLHPWRGTPRDVWLSLWAGRLPASPFASSSVSQHQTPASPLFSCSSDDTASGTASAALAEAATLGSFKSKTAREAARARFAALSCPSSPYSTDPAVALAIALGDASPAYPLSLSFLSTRLSANPLPRSSSNYKSCSSGTQIIPAARAPVRRASSSQLMGEQLETETTRNGRKHSAPPKGPMRFVHAAKDGQYCAPGELRESLRRAEVSMEAFRMVDIEEDTELPFVSSSSQ